MSTQDKPATDTLDPLMDASFNEPSMQERVELIIHLLRHSDRVFTIMSDDANVLSGFSHKLTHHDNKGLHYAEVYPSAGMDTEDIVMHIARGWGVEVDFGETAMNALFQRLPALLAEPRRAVAIVHGADTLPPMILDGLIGFMQRLDQLLDGRVRLILMGSALLTQRIAPMQTLSEAGQVYALHLQPLASTASAQGFVSATAGEALHPNASATNSAPRMSLHSSSSAGQSNNARGLLLGGLGVSLILAVVVAMMLRPDTPEAPKDTTVSIPLTPSVAPSVAPSVTASPAPASAPETPSEPAPAAVEPVAQTAPPIPMPETVATPPASTMPSPAAHEPPAQTAQPSPTQPSVYAPAPAKAVEPAPANDAVVAANTPPPKPTPAPPGKTEAKPKSVAQTGERFSASNASHYVVQIVTLGSAKAVNTFIKTHDLKDCHSFRQQRDGKELFSLTCGLYPSREAALAAQGQLPTDVNAAKPYPRQIADIRKVMLP